jgi:GEVED domain/Pregnancy-associated plasma protein-A/Secretion system C-terminal sorting domain
MKKQIFTLGLGLVAAVSTSAQVKRTYTIPTVVHVLKSTKYPVHEFTEAQVKDAIKNLNEIMQGKKAIGRYGEIVNGFQDKVAGLDVEFVLAKKDKNGAAITGVVLENNTGAWGDAAASYMTSIGGLSKNTPSTNYLNIYVAPQLTSNYQSGVAYRPGETGNSTTIDGVFINSWTFPITYPLSGRQWSENNGYGYANVLAHEVGHYLNLIHMHGSLQNANGEAGCDYVDDLVGDTGSVDNDFDKEYPSTSHKNCDGSGANSNNMMSYSFDANMFTKGQVQRMEAALNSTTQSRKTLWSYANLVSTGVIASGASKYCTAGGNAGATAKEWISKVTLTDDVTKTNVISKASTGDNRYQDFSATPANVSKGKTYTLLVDVNDIYNADTDHDYAAVWFDWNNNGAFENSEKIELWSPGQKTPYLVQTTDATGKAVFQARSRNIAIPATAVTGNVRMRIRTANNDNTGVNVPLYAPFSMSPCGSDLYGEVEDYTLNIQAAAAAKTLVEASSNSDLKIFPTVATSEVNVNAANDSKIDSIDVIDMNGNIVKSVANPSAENSIEVSALSAGTYILNVHTEAATYTSKFIKK